MANRTKKQIENNEKHKVGNGRAGARLDIQAIMDALPFYVLLVDEDHYILQANKVVKEHLGVKPEDIIGKYCPKVVHGVDGRFEGCPLEESIEKGRGVECEVFDKKSGRWLRSAIYPTRGFTEEGKRIYFHYVYDITANKEGEKQLAIVHERLRSLSAHLETIREEERKNVAHDLHDETSQMVASLIAHIEAAISTLPPDAAKTREGLVKARALSSRILKELQTLIYQLHPSVLDDLGLVAAMGWLADTILKTQKIHVDLNTVGRKRRLSPRLETAIFRVVQEAFNNIAKHSNAKHVEVKISFKKSRVAVNIRDDGTGFDVEEALSSKDRPRGLGLFGMKERIGFVNGGIDIQPSPGKGTEISIVVPYTNDNHAE